MSNDYDLGRVAELAISAAPSALAATAGLGVVASGVAAWRGVRGPAALGAGLGVVALHWAGDIAHQLGHATAARQTGHPMTGVRCWALLSSSVYPPAEPALPAAVHIRRALGGPALSALISAALGVLLTRVPPRRRVLRGLVGFALAENVLVFTIGALIPLGFNDGSTLLHWWGQRADGPL